MLALANVGKGAGTCSTVNPERNTLGGAAFRTSCAGWAGEPEYWCADFAAWAWQSTGLYVGGLTASAASFVTSGAGSVHSDPSYVPQPGDAIVFNYDGGRYADHVGLVGAVNPDGSVVTVNGDFGGSGSGAAFARTALVKAVTIRASSRSIGSTPGKIGMTITNYVTPKPTLPSSPAATVDGSGIANAFWRTASGDLRHTFAIGGIWQGTEVLAHSLYNDPVAGPAPDVVWVAGDGSLQRAAFDGSRWSAPVRLPTGGQSLTGRPSLVTDAGGIENVFWTGTDGRLYHDYKINDSWIGPEAIGAGFKSDPSALATLTGEIYVLAQGRHHTLRTSWFSSGRWSGSIRLDLATSSTVGRPDLVLDSTGAAQALWRQADRQLATASVSAGSIGAISLVSGGLGTEPTVTARTSGLDAAFGGTSGRSVSVASSSGGWSASVVVSEGRPLQGHPEALVVGEDLSVIWLTRGGALQAAAWTLGAWKAPSTISGR